jgi:hypothetical protein
MLLGIPAGAITLERRGFRGSNPAIRQRLESIGQSFASGYHAALEHDDLAALVLRLNSLDLDLQGFGYEGAGMGLALLDFLTPWRKDRFRALLEGPGKAQPYMLHVGAGWALARIPGKLTSHLERFDPLLRWLVIDGYGFHEGFFHWRRYLEGQPVPGRLAGYARRAFDQGFGRCLWFIEGGDFERIPQTISAFPPERRGDLWSGVGLAVTYAGEVGSSGLAALRASSGPCWSCLAQGAAFAAKARWRGGSLMPYTDQACVALCGIPARAAAEMTDEALVALPPDGTEPAYETWRARVQARLAPFVMGGRPGSLAGSP